VKQAKRSIALAKKITGVFQDLSLYSAFLDSNRALRCLGLFIF
jgi:hypothetical protein